MGSANNGMSALYQASLLSPEKVQSLSNDLWGNVKIPIMEYLPGFVTAEESQVSVDQSQKITFSLLEGLMVAGLLPERGREFSAQSSYFKLGCEDGRFLNIDNSVERRHGGLTEWLGILGFRSNVSAASNGGVPPNLIPTRQGGTASLSISARSTRQI